VSCLRTVGRRLRGWAVPLLALLIVSLVVIPAETWSHPANDAVYSGFDADLIYVDEDGGAVSEGVVKVSPDSLMITALPDSQPTVHLATTPLKKITASVDVCILEGDSGTVPLRIGIWSPRTETGWFLEFRPSPDNIVVAQTVVQGDPAQTLADGTVVRSQTLGSYTPGQLYRLDMNMDKEAGFIRSRLSWPDGPSAQGSDAEPTTLEAWVTAEEAPELFGDLRAALTVMAYSGGGTSSAELANYSLTLPHQRWQVVKTDDVRARVLLVLLLFLSLILVIVKTAAWVRDRVRQGVALDRGRGFVDDLRRAITMRRGLFFTGVAAAIVGYLVFNRLLFGLGSHSLDMTVEKIWAYVVAEYSPFELYHLPNVVSLAKALGGSPRIEAVFPYQPVMAYISAFVGWAYKLSSSGPHGLTTDTFRLEVLIKAINVLFGLADGLLILLILRKLGVSLRRSLIAGCLFLLNPAVLLNMSVWGQTHAISLFFLLAAVWMIERKLPLWAWLAILAASLTRPQMLVPAFLLALVLLRKFGIRENLHAISWSIILTFLFMAPFLLAIGPSLPVDVLANQFLVQEAGGNDPAMTVISFGFHSIWPLVTHVVGGANGFHRFIYLSTTPLIGGISYQRISLLLTLGLVLVVGSLLLARRKSVARPGDYLPLLAVGVIGFLMLKTGPFEAYAVTALPFLILCRKSLGDAGYYSLVCLWSFTTLVPMWAALGFSMEGAGYCRALPLHPSNTVLTLVFMNLQTRDWFITAGSAANTWSLALLALGRMKLPPMTPRRQRQAR